MDLVSCYHILGIEPGAPFTEVKAAYRQLARRYHPDVNPDHVEWASQQFIKVMLKGVHPDLQMFFIKTSHFGFLSDRRDRIARQ